MSASTASKAIQLLQQGVEQIRREADEQIAELTSAISRLQRERAAGSSLSVPVKGKPNGRTHAIRSDQYRGMKKTQALDVYMRSRRGDGRIPLATVVRDLLAGQADLGTPDRYERNLILVVKNRTKVFGYDEKAREIWLAPTADEESKPKPRRERRIT